MFIYSFLDFFVAKKKKKMVLFCPPKKLTKERWCDSGGTTSGYIKICGAPSGEPRGNHGESVWVITPKDSSASFVAKGNGGKKCISSLASISLYSGTIFVDPSPYTINLLIAYDENSLFFSLFFFFLSFTHKLRVQYNTKKKKKKREFCFFRQFISHIYATHPLPKQYQPRRAVGRTSIHLKFDFCFQKKKTKKIYTPYKGTLF